VTRLTPVSPAAVDALSLFPLLSMLLFTLYRGGNVDSLIIAYAGLGAICFAITGVALWQRARRTVAPKSRLDSASMSLIIAVFVMLALHALLCLYPLDASVWSTLPGRKALLDVVQSLQLPRLPASIDPFATRRALLLLIAAGGAFALCCTLSARSARIVLGCVMGLAVVEAVVGLLQVALATPSWLGYESAVGGRRASGSFVNKNHFATLMAMTLPLFILRANRAFTLLRESPDRMPSALVETLWHVGAILVGAALLASLSRAGLFAGALAALLCASLCAVTSRTITGRAASLMIVVLTVALAGLANLSALIDSVTSDQFAVSVDSRALMTSSTFAAAREFLPIGSGLGSFAIAFQRFQPASLSGFIEYAHNDYAQLLFEAGWVGVMAIVAAVVAFALTGYRTVSLVQKKLASAWFRLGALCAVLAVAIHAWFDFPLHIPALAILASMFAGLSLRTHGEAVLNPAKRFVANRPKSFAQNDSPPLDAVP
jgi:hypothetical protein